LEASQKNEVSTCPGGKPLQYRILTPHLGREEVRSFVVTPLSKEQLKAYRARIKALVAEIRFYNKVYHLSQQPSAAECQTLEQEWKALKITDVTSIKKVTRIKMDELPIHLYLSLRGEALENNP